ncbi:hypothetical protein HOLleu_07802 [Holothuria leucospilota]|uniref:Death domain-containing protein n=1 Tax=Holothuria leucospilota TaxID=206669 RepID=A0A9Q1CGI1_HOLLE|nr:hypothetical protein HOLleu_07802 [Holothuria leucospilota]
MEYLKGQFQNKDLTVISRKIGRDGEFLGRYLGLEDDQITLIQQDNPRNCRERNYQILKKWIEQKGCEATSERLIAAFLDMERKDLADEYKQIFAEQAKGLTGDKRKRKRPSSESSKSTDPPKRQEETSSTVKDKTTNKAPAGNKGKRKIPSPDKGTIPAKRQKKNPAPSEKTTPAKRKEVVSKTGQASNKIQSISLKIIDQEDRGYPTRNAETGVWFRGKFQAGNESEWFYVIIWGDQEKQKISLFKKGHSLVLKNVTLKGNEISFGEYSKVEKCGAPIKVGKDVLRKIEKNEKKSYKSLEEIKMSGKASKTKLRVCEPGECKRNDKGTLSRNLKVKNKKSSNEVWLTLFGTDARKALEERQLIVLNVWFNTSTKKFEPTGNFIMKILKKSKKGKSKKGKKKSKRN